MRKYQLRYSIENGAFSERDSNKYGLTDQLLLCSYLENEDGGGSYAWVSSNGKEKGVEMDWSRQMHCWIVLTKKLSEDAPANCLNQKRILEQIFQIFREAIVNSHPSS